MHLRSVIINLIFENPCLKTAYDWGTSTKRRSKTRTLGKAAWITFRRSSLVSQDLFFSGSFDSSSVAFISPLGLYLLAVELTDLVLIAQMFFAISSVKGTDGYIIYI